MGVRGIGWWVGMGVAFVLVAAVPGRGPVQGEGRDGRGCEPEGTAEFAFWIGTWELSWENGAGTNRVRRILDDCVIEERFDGVGPSGAPYRGVSHTVYDARAGVWRQTWVDSQGSYLDFTGGMVDDRMILSRTTERDGQTVHQRMVWHSIEADRLEWSWEASTDGGTTWTTQWAISYVRTK